MVVNAIDASNFGGPKATTTADAFYIDSGSEGYRNAGNGAIVAGAYDYYLVRGHRKDENESNWYLTSKPSGGDTDPIPEPYRPEVDGYLINAEQANALQRHKWQDRRGQTQNQEQDAIAWIRVQTNKSSFNNTFDNKRHSDSHVIHFGTDVMRYDLADGSRLDAGVMGLIGTSSSDAKTEKTKAKADLTSYNVGGYVTWQEKPYERTGSYVDSWLLHGWNRNQVKGDGLNKESYHSRNLSLSVEAGHSFALSQQADNAWYLQPQAQVIWSKGFNSSHTEDNKTQVKWDNKNQLSARIGARVWVDMQTQQGSQWQPFAEVNLWRLPNKYSMQFDQDRIKDKVPSRAVELALGVQGQVSPEVHIWSRFGVQQGNRQLRNLNGQLGVTYSW